MKGILRLTLLTSFVAMAVGSAMAGENSFKVLVKDKNGKPVPGVTLSVLSGGKKFGAGTTGANGEVNVPLDLGNVSTGQSTQAVVRKCHAEDGTETSEMILAAAGSQVPPKENCDDHVAGLFPWPTDGGAMLVANLDNLTLGEQGGAASSSAATPTRAPQATAPNAGNTGPAVVCNVMAGVSPTVRKEGLTEFTGDITLRCTGTTAAPSPNPGDSSGNTRLNIKLSVGPIGPKSAGGEEPSFVIHPGPVAATTLPDGRPSTTTGVVSGPSITFDGIPNTPYDIKITHIEISAVNPSTDQPPSGIELDFSQVNVEYPVQFKPPVVSIHLGIVPPSSPATPAQSPTTLSNGNKYVEEGGGGYFTVTAYDSSGTAFAHLEITVHGSFVEVSTSSTAKPERVTSFVPWDGKSTLELGNIINKIKSDFIANTQSTTSAASGAPPPAAANPATPPATAQQEVPWSYWWEAGGGLGVNSFSSVNSCGSFLSAVPDATCQAGDRSFGGEVEGRIGVTPYFAGGFSYFNFQSINRNAVAPTITEHSSIHTQFEAITGRVILPIRPFSIFGEGGVAFVQNHLKEIQSGGSGSTSGALSNSLHVNTTSPTVGGGVEFDVSKHFALAARFMYLESHRNPVLNTHSRAAMATFVIRGLLNER